jgi:hypothetical protein
MKLSQSSVRLRRGSSQFQAPASVAASASLAALRWERNTDTSVDTRGSAVTESR